MCTVVDNGEVVIILSDDDDDDDDILEISLSEASVLLMETEDVRSKDLTLSPSKINEDLVVTFARPAELLPHARYDCTIHPFTASDNCVAPVSGNQNKCEQCFCYICDKLASTCEKWQLSQVCHCNSHKKSDFWNGLRNSLLLGQLEAFKFTLSEIDDKLRHAETLLRSFKVQLKDNYTVFLHGKHVGDGLVHDYTPVYKCVSAFLNAADKEDDRAAAVMRLGAAEEFIPHLLLGRLSSCKSSSAFVTNAKVMLMQRVVSSVQKQMVMADFAPGFCQKLEDFYRKLHFPPELRNMKLSLCVRPWDDILLVSVLKGQNVQGVRTNRGKKDYLLEDMDVILLRVERLLQENRFRELSRYLRAVQTDQPKRFLLLKDLIPFFMCLEGNFSAVLTPVVLRGNGPASRLTPQIFQWYLRMLSTATAPKWTISRTCELCPLVDAWSPIEGAQPLSCLELVRFALNVYRCCPAVLMNSECWIHLLRIVCGAVTSHPEPSPGLLKEAVHVVNSIMDESGNNVQIPPNFVSQYQDQAMLLLVTGALARVIACPDLKPVIPILCTCKKKQWALRWLWSILLPINSHNVVIAKIYYELITLRGNPKKHVPDKPLFPAAKDWDHCLQLTDILPLILAFEGDFPAALDLFPPGNGPVLRLTPHTFQFYFQMFKTAHAPMLAWSRTSELCTVRGQWHPIKGAVPLTNLELVRFAIMVHRCSQVVHMDSESWTHLLKTVSTTIKSVSFKEPSPEFLHEAVHSVNSILLTESYYNMEIPPYFVSQFPDQATLLLAVGALSQIILHPDLSPVTPILCTFQNNIWALNWFWNRLLSKKHRIGLVKKIYQELENCWEDTLMCLQSTRKVLFPAAENWDLNLQLGDLLPLLLCVEGQLTPAMLSFYPSEKGALSNLRPHVFEVYMNMFSTCTAPKLTVSQTGELCFFNKLWGPIAGVHPVGGLQLLSFVLLVHRCNLVIYTNSDCWISLLMLVGGAHKSIPKPSEVFLREAVQLVNSILQNCSSRNMNISGKFPTLDVDQSKLLLLTGALREIILHPLLSPVIPILNTFQSNMWALCWFWNTCDDKLHNAIMQKIYRELGETSVDPTNALHSIRHLLDPQARLWHQ
ncbi:uncharacterized protein zgc:112980 isoform X2 [Nerophis ophidion]|uniref:uncharacterized protein zgc:112980 isoform X2 n=1 Tax=Nerophis ophidion TaxID=159077 RepID=UPI002ADF0898|nr:uncharacterized protein zgc:112980 isoform X2 [Nerophis ophidion]